MSISGYFRTVFRLLRSKRFLYSHLVEVLIDKEALRSNLHSFQKLNPNLSVAPVLKSNAYGHGLIPVAKIISKEAVPFICVDSFFEAMILRNENIATPILILGYTPFENIKASKLSKLSFSVLSLDELKSLAAKVTVPISIHLKIDSGMRRHGIISADLDEAISILQEHSNILLEGIYTHLADADVIGSTQVKKQISTWNNCVKRFRQSFLSLRYVHCAATPGSFYNYDIEANVMRLGIGLYGVNPSLAEMVLKPVLEMRSKITSIRNLSTGDSVGYNATFTADRPMKVATIPVGYTEGLDRRLSNRGAVLINRHLCPIIGRVSMNISSIDVTDLPQLKREDEVIIISKDRDDPNSIEAMARTCNTIAYEIMVHIPPHLKRIVV